MFQIFIVCFVIQKLIVSLYYFVYVSCGLETKLNNILSYHFFKKTFSMNFFFYKENPKLYMFSSMTFLWWPLYVYKYRCIYI